MSEFAAVDSQPAELTLPAGTRNGLRQLGLVRALCLGLLVAALWAATRPYLGIFHDSRFYTLEALNSLLPGRFSHDLYFQYGSQGRFTIFSLIYAPLISLLGLSGGNIALTIAAQALWLSGLGYLSYALFRDGKLAVMAVAATILLSFGLAFPYGEAYVTPRSFAEALTFWALGSQLNARPVRALALLGVSMLIHPLVTLPVLAVWFLIEAARRRIWWLFAAVAAAVVVALAIAGVQPFSLLFARFDAAWFEIIRTREDFCFVSLWRWDRWFPIGGSFALGFFEFTLATPSERRVLVPVFVVGAGGILASLIGGDILRNVLLFDIQTWRFMWLFSLITNLFAVKFLLRFAVARPIPSSPTAWLLGLALGSTIISRFFEPMMIGTIILLVLALFAGCWEWIGKRPIPFLVRLALALLIGCALPVLFLGAQIVASWLSLSPATFWGALRQLGLSLCISGAIWFVLFRSEDRARKRLHPAVLLVATLVLTVIAGWQWDQRTPWRKFVDASNPPSGLTDLLPGKAPIYWEGDVATPWFLLKRASYFSCDQGTGVLFSRGTAIAYAARYESFQKLQTLDFRQASFCPLTETRRTTPLRRAELSALCTKETGLGALVLMERVADAPYRLWVSTVPFETLEQPSRGVLKAFSGDRFYVYTCADFRVTGA